MKLYSFVLLWLLAAAMLACGPARKTTITTSSPTSTHKLPELPASQINVPVKVYMRPLLARMDSMTAREFTSEKWPAYMNSACDFRYKYRFVRSPFVFSCVNNRVNIAFRSSYQIAGSRCVCAFNRPVSPWISGSCGFGNEPLRRVDLNIHSMLTLLPGHQLLTATHIDKLNAVDKCQVTLMETDMTQMVIDSIRASVESYCTTFDRFVQTLNNNEMLRQWRGGGSRVMPISRYGFLNLNPTALRVGKFNVYRDTLFFSVGFSGSPQFSSDSMRLVTQAPLPPVSNSEGDGQISTYLNAVYEYKFFNRLLNDSLRNKPFELEGRTFVIRDVAISGTNEGKIQVDLSFTGNRTGVLHLSGTPLLDTAHQVLTMPDISFALDTKDMMMKIARSLFRKKIMKQLHNQSVFDIAALIAKNRSAIEARLNQQVTPWMSTAGSLDDIRVLGLLPQKDYIQVQAYISGRLALTGQPPAAILRP